MGIDRDVVVELEPGVTSFVGRNGVGKTNLIEAISFLVPGRGLRRATLDEVPFAEGAKLKVLRESSTILRDAWLMQTGHKRPGVKGGLPLAEAEARSAELIGEYLRK